jgi:hypothetical protein
MSCFHWELNPDSSDIRSYPSHGTDLAIPAVVGKCRIFFFHYILSCLVPLCLIS